MVLLFSLMFTLFLSNCYSYVLEILPLSKTLIFFKCSPYFLKMLLLESPKFVLIVSNMFFVLSVHGALIFS